MLKSNTQRTIQIPKVATQDLNTLSPNLLNKILNLGCHPGRDVTKVLISSLGRQALSESAHREGRIGVTLPSISSVRLNHHGRLAGAGLKDRLLVLAGLLLEESGAGEGDDAGFDSVFAGKEIAGLHCVAHLGANTDESDVEVFRLGEDVSAAGDTFAGRVLWELGQVLAREGDDGRGLGGLDRSEEGSCDLLGVTWADVKQVGHGAIEGRKGDGLMGRPIFSGAYAVMGGDVDLLKALEGSHANGRRSIEVEHEERGSDGEESSLPEGGQTV